MKTSKEILLTLGLLLIPCSVMAGGYGTAGVKDASVSQSTASEATVWCPKLNENIPLRLQQQMDCGQGVPAVAGDERRGFFGTFRHVPQGNRPNSRDGDDKQPSPRVASAPDGNGNSPVDKYERLGQLNLTVDKVKDQSPEFQQQFNDYRNTHGVNGDWSGFNPN